MLATGDGVALGVVELTGLVEPLGSVDIGVVEPTGVVEPLGGVDIGVVDTPPSVDVTDVLGGTTGVVGTLGVEVVVAAATDAGSVAL